MAEKAIAHTSRQLLADVFGGMGKVAEESAETLFSAIVRTGSALVTDIADTIPDGITSKKGLQEKVSGWLGRYRLAERVDRRLWKEGLSLVGRDTVVAVDSGDISKEFGGAGMEGMEMGHDASRGVTAMGHSLPCAAVVCRRRAMPMRMSLRKGLPDAERERFDAIADATGGGAWASSPAATPRSRCLSCPALSGGTRSISTPSTSAAKSRRRRNCTRPRSSPRTPISADGAWKSSSRT